jgi:transposase-like protein
MGPVELPRPKLRGNDEALCSRLFGAGVTRTNALESLVISGWVRGLSDRGIEAALAEVLGPEAALPRSTVSRICQRIRDQFEAWRTRDGISSASGSPRSRPLGRRQDRSARLQQPPGRTGPSRVVGIFPNEAAVVRLVGAPSSPTYTTTGKPATAYLSEGSMALLYPERDTLDVAALTAGD